MKSSRVPEGLPMSVKALVTHADSVRYATSYVLNQGAEISTSRKCYHAVSLQQVGVLAAAKTECITRCVTHI